MARTRRKLSDLGESELIARIARRAGRTPGRDWVLGIGDDAAILRPRPNHDLVFSTDALVEGTHFLLGRELPRTIGRRAMAINLSDLAAMGARPVGALLSLSAPATLEVDSFDGLIRGLVDEGRSHGCPLVGGNLARADGVSLDVTVIGECGRDRALTRRGLEPGDGLFVTGTLGGATLARHRADATGGRLLRVPTPRLEAGRALARLRGTRSCIDLSDGLSTDLAHLLEGDDLGARVDLSAAPRPRAFGPDCRALGLDPDRVIALGGEDYELLFAFRSRPHSDPSGMLRARLGVAVTRIGEITDENGIQGLPPAVQGHHF